MFSAALRTEGKVTSMPLILPQAKNTGVNLDVSWTQVGSGSKYGISILTTKYTSSFRTMSTLRGPTVQGSQAEKRLTRDTLFIFLI